MLPGCLILATDDLDAPGSGFHPMIFGTTPPRRNVVRAGRRGTTYRAGQSPMIGPSAFRVTDAEADVFEAWFGDLFDELFGPCR